MSENIVEQSGGDRPAVTIDVISDVMCPWCYIGKRRLEKALAEINQDFDTEVRWHPYQLDATLPAEGKDRKQYLEEKFGGPEGAKRVYDTIEHAGASENIPFNFDAIEVSPNTLDAHRLLALASSLGFDIQNKLAELLFEAFFINGAHIGKHDVLAELAGKAGLDPEKVKLFLESDDLREETRGAVQRAHEIGVQGVPFFIIDKKLAMSGAQEPATIVHAVKQAVSTSAQT